MYVRVRVAASTGEKAMIRLVQTLTGLCQHINVDETTCPNAPEGVPLESVMTVGDLKKVVVDIVPEVCIHKYIHTYA